jgi:uncharacterized membrane protein
VGVIRSAAQRARESLFFAPLVVIALCSVLAFVALIFDESSSLEGVPLLLSATVSGGRVVVTTVAGATITVAAIVFSVTALSTQMAANQYSPRVLRGFLEDPFQQLVLGFVVGTFTYSLIVLGGLSDVFDDPAHPTPSVSVTLAAVLGVLSVIAIVAYLDHSLRRMQIDAVVQRIARAALAAVRREHRQVQDERPPTEFPGTPSGQPATVTSNRSGWIIEIDAKLLARTLPPDAVARVGVRLGEAVSAGDRVVAIWPDPGENGGLTRRVRRCIRTGRVRSIETSPEFGIRQLVDIALRALSPGVNDPTTAVDVIYHLKVPIREILVSAQPVRVFSGPAGQRVFLAESPSRSDYVHGAFSEIRLAADDQPYVLQALIEVLGDLITELEAEELAGRVDALVEEYQLTTQAAEHADMPQQDIDRVLRAADDAVVHPARTGDRPAAESD